LSGAAAVEVRTWLEGLGLGQYAGAFADNHVDAGVLPTLTADDLRELGVASLGHRKRLLTAIDALRPPPASPAQPAAPPAAARSLQSVTPRYLAERILKSRAALEGERKQVTVLFADIRGSMELIAGMDMEEARSVLDPTVDAMMAAVHRYEGTVNKVLGDGIMALFGAPIAHEDHAVRAAYAALAIQEAVRRQAEALRRRLGVEVQVRVGLHSGEVVVRAIGNDLTMDYDAIGPTTHLAARMEQLAPPGAIRLTAATLRLAEGFLRVASLGAVPVKGVPEPVEIFDLVGASEARTRLQAAAAGGLSRFVGRDDEIGAMARALERAGEGRGQIVSVVGEPGVGKSRLFYEFVQSHRTKGWLVLQAGSVSHGKATSYLPAIDLLKGYFGIGGRDDARRIREMVAGKIVTLDESLRAIAPALLSLFDVKVEDDAWLALEPAQRRRRTLEACRALLLRESREQPLVVVFEDLHWVDGETLALIDGLVESMAGARILLLLNYRPEFADPWANRSYASRLRIEPLRPQSAGELLADLLGADESLGPLRELLIERTEGNPFFLEESVRELVESGALGGRRGAYRQALPLTSIRIAPTVHAVLAARMDRLAPEDKALLQSAAVIGKDFALPLLEAIVERSPDDVRRGLAALQESEFVYETRLFPEPEYTFRHALSHDVAYNSLLGERRRALHGRIVEGIERQAGTRAAERAERLAYHAQRAEQWEQAYRYAREAGDKAAARNDSRGALESYRQALAALARLAETPDRVAERVDLLFLVRDALFVLGEPKEVPALMAEAERLSLQGNDRGRLAWASLYLASFYWQTGQQDKAIEMAGKARAIWQERGERERVALVDYRFASIYVMNGDFAAAADHAERCLDVLDNDAGRRLFAFGGLPFSFAATFGAWALAELGDFAAAEAIGRRGFEAARQADHSYSLSVASFGLGHAYLLQGRLDAAAAILEQGLERTRIHGVRASVAWVTARLAYAYAASGRAELTDDLIRLALETDPGGFFTASADLWLARAYAARGEAARARETAESSLERGRRSGERGLEPWAEWLLAGLDAAAAAPDRDAVLAGYDRAAALAGPLGMRPVIAHCHYGKGQALAAQGRRAEAAAELAAAREAYRSMRMERDLAAAERALAALA
jgi:class 3 adenylate cyclase/tetratricopeptide (TPR) repeat protein